MRDWRSLIGNRQLSPEAVDELAQHLEDTYQAAIAGGKDDDAAMRAVEEELADLDRTAKHLDIRTPRIGLLERIRQFINIDLRDAFRRLRRSPGFSVLAIAVLAVGLGVNTAIFSLINALLYKPLPVRAPNELVFLYHVDKGYYGGVPGELFDRLSADKTMFRQLDGAVSDAGWVTIDGQVQKLIGNAVTSGYLETLGVTPQLGRAFNAAEDAAGAAPILLISDQLWTSSFHRDPSIIGKTIRLSPSADLTVAIGRDYTVIGVMPPGFSGTGSAASWLSPSYYVLARQRAIDSACAKPDGTGIPVYRWPLSLFGRLADGVSFKTASDFVTQSAPGWEHEWWKDGPPPAGSHFELRQTRFARLPIDAAGTIVPERLATAVIIVSGLLLLVAASNLVGVLMARSVATRTDTAIRMSLGAGRWRVARQHLTEGYLLGLAGTLVGLLVARVLAKLFVFYLPVSSFGSGGPIGLGGTAVSVPVAFDARALAFSFGTCAIVGAIIGFGPALQASKTDVLPTLQLAASTSARSPKGFRHWIVVPQIAVALVLLIVTGAVSRTVITSEMTDPGYVPDGLVAVQFQLPGPDRCAVTSNYPEFKRRRDDLVQQISNRLPALTSVQSAAISSFLPHEQINFGGSVIRQEDGITGQIYGVRLFNVSPDYFATMKIRIADGRTFSDADILRSESGQPSAVIVSHKLATTLWPGRNAVGRMLAQKYAGSTLPPRWVEVIGVAEDVLSPLNDGYPAPALYGPGGSGAAFDRVVARANASEPDAIREITAAVRSSDPAAVVVAAGTVSDGIRQVRFARRLAMVILGGAALIGLALAAIGLYGVVSYALSQRIREFGIRAALGANYRDLVALVLKEALIVASIGSAIGLAAAYSAIGLISSKLVAIPSVNTGIVIGGPAIVFIAVALACYLPARRAARVDPLIVLRGL